MKREVARQPRDESLSSGWRDRINSRRALAVGARKPDFIAVSRPREATEIGFLGQHRLLSGEIDGHDRKISKVLRGHFQKGQRVSLGRDPDVGYRICWF